ncbi:ATP-binding protein [Paraburkholderia sp.]|uniref:ATP-binding protein n=1 Tax=Paraburkholderia sp. TaxID=1926495 RepID=UPI003D6E87C8
MNNPFNTLFGRLALMTVSLIVLVHITSILLVERDREGLAVTQAARALTLANQVQTKHRDASAAVASLLGLSFVDPHAALATGCPAPCTDTYGPFERDLRRRLPAGSHVVAGGDTLWVQFPPASHAKGGDASGNEWIALRNVVLPVSRYLGASTLTLALAIIVAVLGAWRLQRPLRQLAHAAREFRVGHRATAVQESGPREVRELIGDFNEMVHELELSEQERAVMLAGLAHDLRAPITRMQVRADLLPDEANRAGFMRDAESLSRIVTQFLDFARDAADPSPRTQVDQHCRRHYGDSLADEALVALKLQAGDGFSLPLVDLDRILSNLIENAFTYGDAPVEIATVSRQGSYTLTVRDHGAGIPPDQLERALRPFVRLDAARGGDAHCGLGLAIVRRLARYNGGSFAAANVAGGGFAVTLTFGEAARSA